MKTRYLATHIVKGLKGKMVFRGGARQVGKTSLAKYIAENHFKSYDYLNWDARDDRLNILQSQFKVMHRSFCSMISTSTRTARI